MKICLLTAKPLGDHIGGKQALTSQILEVLSREHDVTLVTFDKFFDAKKLDADYGLNLASRRFSVRSLYKYIPTKHASFWFLRNHLLMRYAKKHAPDFDLFFSASGELDLGSKPGMQVIYFPTPALFTKESNSILGNIQRHLAFKISNCSLENMRSNASISISAWVAEQAKAAYGIDSDIIYPPIAEQEIKRYSNQDWNSRENGFVAITRFVREKRIEDIIAILEEVRKNDGAIHLHIVGGIQDSGYFNKIKQRIGGQDWVRIEKEVSREKMLQLLGSHKFGIHAMHNEHFGIVIGEMVLAGLVPFVHNSGGQVEIVGKSNFLTYNSVADASKKILTVLKNSQYQEQILADLKAGALRFTKETFTRDLLAFVNKKTSQLKY